MKSIGLVVGMVPYTFVMLLGMANPAMAQGTSDINAVRAANDAFYAALSAHNIGAVVVLWSFKAEIRHIGAHDRVIHVGLDAAVNSWKDLFTSFPDFKIHCDPNYIRINGNTAWVNAIESAQWTNQAGESQTETYFGTNIFEKQDGEWFMVYRHASIVPQETPLGH